MGSVEDIDFGPDTDAIRRWLAQRGTYAGEAGDPVRDGHRIDAPSRVEWQQLPVPGASDIAHSGHSAHQGLPSRPARPAHPSGPKRKGPRRKAPKHRRETSITATLTRVRVGYVLS